MRRHRYRITVKHICTAKDGQILRAEPLIFEAHNHDDVIAIVERMQANADLKDEAASLWVGVKLLSEIAISRRNYPAYRELAIALATLIGQVKSGAV